ncbi:MAG: cytochrome P450, partial [Acidobacteria bacterium]|nr:cytochrome P450 [Acidobacteriota bacterium]
MAGDRTPSADWVTLDDLEHDPHPTLARLRTDHPVAWVPALGMWMITSRTLALAAMQDFEGLTVDDPRFSTGQVVGPSMLSLDGPEHTR